MTPAARRPGVPRMVVMTWALSALLGGAAVGVAATRPEPLPRTLSPYTVARYLTDIAPAARDDVRVNGIYGSGHRGAWQFVAHVTWRAADGTIDGGVTNLPLLAGNLPGSAPSIRRASPKSTPSAGPSMTSQPYSRGSRAPMTTSRLPNSK